MKICSKCKQLKSLDNFYKFNRGKNGFESQCKTCKKKYNQENAFQQSEYRKIYYIDNPEKFYQGDRSEYI
jgi:hypothetical protein